VPHWNPGIPDFGCSESNGTGFRNYPHALKVDGGACANNLLMQFQSDIIGAPVHRPVCVETTAMGASYLAGLAVKYWASKEDVLKNWKISKVFKPTMDESKREELLKGWHKAVKCALGWAKD
jgi:glycerol kinase